MIVVVLIGFKTIIKTRLKGNTNMQNTKKNIFYGDHIMSFSFGIFHEENAS